MFSVSTPFHGSQFLQGTLKKKKVSQEHREWYVRGEDVTIRILLALSRPSPWPPNQGLGVFSASEV